MSEATPDDGDRHQGGDHPEESVAVDSATTNEVKGDERAVSEIDWEAYLESYTMSPALPSMRPDVGCQDTCASTGLAASAYPSASNPQVGPCGKGAGLPVAAHRCQSTIHSGACKAEWPKTVQFLRLAREASARSIRASLVLQGSTDEARKERVGRQGAALELRVELAGDEEGVFGVLHHLHQASIGGSAREHQAPGHEPVPIVVVELVAVPVPL